MQTLTILIYLSVVLVLFVGLTFNPNSMIENCAITSPRVCFLSMKQNDYSLI